MTTYGIGRIMGNSAVAALAVVCAVGVSFDQAFGQRAVNELAQLVGSDTTAGDDFGWCVAIDGDVAVVGAYNDDNKNGSNAGCAYIFRYGEKGWSEEAKLLASDGEGGDVFGQGVPATLRVEAAD